MDQKTHGRLCEVYWDIWNRVQTDPEYAMLRRELEELEPLYESVLGALSPERRDLIDRIVVLRETMGRRALEFACEEFLFSDNVPCK